jgi:hypothetical protein
LAVSLVDTHGQSPWHFKGQASLDLNPDPPAISHTETAEKVFTCPLKDEKWGLLYVIHSYKDAKI